MSLSQKPRRYVLGFQAKTNKADNIKLAKFRQLCLTDREAAYAIFRDLRETVFGLAHELGVEDIYADAAEDDVRIFDSIFGADE